MIGVHDVGGYHFGPIDTHDDVVFHEDWEGLTFALLLVSGTVGTWALDEFRHLIEKMPPHEYLTTPYYIHWLEAIEQLCINDGFVTREELDERKQAILEGKPLPPAAEIDPAVVERLIEGARGIAYVGLGARRPDQSQSFAVGDRVRALPRAVPGHTRLPWFTWGRTGVIVAYSGTFPLPDTVAHRKGENPEPVYAVRFEGTDLWGEGAEPNTSLTLDMWESYMEPITAASGT